MLKNVKKQNLSISSVKFIVMKEKRLKLIISAMALALIGLISVQLYWVINVVKLEEARFESDVSDALTFVIEKIDKNETAEVVVKRVIKNSDSPIYIVNEHQTTKHKLWVGDTMAEDTEIEFFTSGNDSNISVNVDLRKNNDSTNSNVLVYTYSNSSSGNKTKVVSKEHLNAFVNKKKEVFEDVIEELVTISNIKIEDRITKAKLDSLLNFEFKNIGINTEYNFGVLDKNKNQFIYVKKEDDQDELEESHFRAQLFPEDILKEPNFLFVSFPNQREYVIKSISATLGLSIGFILLIIFIFYKTVQMLIKQKKITEIKNDLINNITHEFKTPLSTISLACEALNEPKLFANGTSVLRYSKIISDENTRLKNLVENLLSSASLEKGEIEINKQEIDLHKSLAEVVDKFELMLENQNGYFQCELNAVNSNVNIDPFHLSIIFNNIIDNALKYNEREPAIRIATDNKDDKIIVSISDNGIGIKKSELKNIFDSFYRVPTGNIHNVKGSGMGLHYVKKLTEANGGIVYVTSTLGEGTVFNIEFTNE